jgi:hypothetical protein
VRSPLQRSWYTKSISDCSNKLSRSDILHNNRNINPAGCSPTVQHASLPAPLGLILLDPTGMAFNFTTQIKCLPPLPEKNRAQPIKGQALFHTRSKPKSIYQVDCIIVNALNFCLGGVWFKSWPGHWLPWLQSCESLLTLRSHLNLTMTTTFKNSFHLIVYGLRQLWHHKILPPPPPTQRLGISVPQRQYTSGWDYGVLDVPPCSLVCTQVPTVQRNMCSRHLMRQEHWYLSKHYITSTSLWPEYPSLLEPQTCD